MTGYQSKKKAASAKTIDQVNWADHEPDGLVHTAQPHCQCSACKDGKLHLSDCAVHNEPAYPAGPCDCGVLNQQIAQPAQEPKSVTYKEVADTMNALRKGNFSQQAAAKEVGKLKLYTTPPQRPWVGLTDEEKHKTWYEMQNIMGWYSFQEIAQAIEAKLKEKNT